jgi:hypothetical protein
MSVFSKLMDQAVESHFRRDRGGRMVFIPFSLRRNCYFVDAKADQEKIRALVRMYRSLFQIIAFLSYPGIFVPVFILDGLAGLTPRGHRLAITMAIPLFFWLVLGALEWILWSLYKGAIPSFTSTLTEVGPETKEQIRGLSQGSRRLRVVLVVSGLLLIALAVLALLVGSHFRG